MATMDDVKVNGVTDEAGKDSGPEPCHKGKGDNYIKSSEQINGQKNTCINGQDDIDVISQPTIKAANMPSDEKMDVDEAEDIAKIDGNIEQVQSSEGKIGMLSQREISKQVTEEQDQDDDNSQENERTKKDQSLNDKVIESSIREAAGGKNDSTEGKETKTLSELDKNESKLDLGNVCEGENKLEVDENCSRGAEGVKNDSTEGKETENLPNSDKNDSKLNLGNDCDGENKLKVDEKCSSRTEGVKNDSTEVKETENFSNLDKNESKLDIGNDCDRENKVDRNCSSEANLDNKEQQKESESESHVKETDESGKETNTDDQIHFNKDKQPKNLSSSGVSDNTSKESENTEKLIAVDNKVEDPVKPEDNRENRGSTSGKNVSDKIDIDGDEFIITINEDNESDKDEDHKTESLESEAAKSDIKSDSLFKGESTKNDAEKPKDPESNKSSGKIIADVLKSDKVETPKITTKVPGIDKKAAPTTLLAPHGQNLPSYFNVQNGQILIQPTGQPQTGTLRYLIPSVPGTAPSSSSQLVQHLVVTSGGQQLLLNSNSTAFGTPLNAKTPFSSLLSKTASNIRSFPPQPPPRPSVVKHKPPEKPPVPTSKENTADSSSKENEKDITLPVGSWEMLDIVKWEVASHKPDNTFWTGLCNVNKKAEVSSVTKFLFDLGSDIVKESAYRQITHVQQKKKDAGKLSDLEKENLDKMKKVVKELEDKLLHLSMKKKRCNGCDFVTESDNVMSFHKEHPHMEPPLNPHGEMNCCYCDYKTKEATQFSFHMEAEHSKTGRVYSKPAFYQCGLCYFEHNQKNKLTVHKWKCLKHFKANHNQAPQHPDVNYCLKNTFYKFQIKKPPAPVKQALQHKHDTRKKVTPIPSIKTQIVQPSHPIQPRTVTTVTAANAAKSQQPVNYVRTPVAYNHQQTTFPNFNKNMMGVQVMQNVYPLQSKSNKGLVHQAMPIQPPQTQPQYRPASQKPTVGQLLKSGNINDSTNKTSTPSSGGFEVCEICGGYVKDKMSLRIHFFYAHKIDMPLTVFNRDVPPLICEVCKARYWTTQGLTKHKQAARHSAQVTRNVPSGSICWICHQKQDNLYSHLVKFHRLSTAECMAIKRCMFCGHLAANRKELEIHMAAAHGVIIKAEAAANPAISSSYKKVGPQTVVVGPTKAVVNTTTKAKGGQGLVRNNFCVFCSTQFSDNTQLTLHCLGSHATCSSCGMVVAKQADLAKHVCRTMLNRTCPICKTRNLRPNFYTKHLLTHLKRCSVRVKRLHAQDIKKAKVKVKDDVIKRLKNVQKAAIVVKTMKPVKIDNADDPIVLDSDEESKSHGTVVKRKSETKTEAEPLTKKSKVEQKAVIDSKSDGGQSEEHATRTDCKPDKIESSSETDISEEKGKKVKAVETEEKGEEKANTAEGEDGISTGDKPASGKDSEISKDKLDDDSNDDQALKKSSDDEKLNESNNDADDEDESTNSSV